MDPTLTWIDASEVQAAIAQVRRAGPRPPSTPAPELSPDAPLEPLTPVEPLKSPRTLAERVHALADWVELNLRPKRWFLADDQGLPIYDAGIGEVGIGELTHAMREWRPGGQPTPIEAVTYHLTGGRRVLALWVSTQMGVTAVGLENPHREALQTLRKAVEYALRGRASA